MTVLNYVSVILFSLTRLFLGISDYTIPKMEGGEQPLNVYAGKNVLLISLPIVQDSTGLAMLTSIDSIAAANTSTLQVIGIPSVEDGFLPANRASLLQWYRSILNNRVLISDGLQTHKTSASNQHALFGWLTQVGKNGVFDIDAEGPGQKFFVNEEGKLYAVLSPLTPLSSRVVSKILSVQ
jgi:hypothetical protein